jgi:hypothetical protein
MNPPMWSGEGITRLAEGMPKITPTGLKGERSQSRADLNAENFGLDEEVLQAADRMLIASE